MKKLLVVCGPTATGKTSLGLHLAMKLDGEIISSDSRQVYKGMDIGTGKALPKGAKIKDGGYYLVKGVKIWGYNLVDPTKEFSVSQYVAKAHMAIRSVWEKGKLPILIGGTGFYIEGVVDGIPTVSIPKNKKIRESLKDKSVVEMFDHLAQLDPVKAASMNISDKKNPRRLIRAIEIALWRLKGGKERDKKLGKNIDTLFIGLKARKKFHDEIIKERVKKRLVAGFGKEVEGLLSKGVSVSNQSMQSLGYRQWAKFLEGKKTRSEAIDEWVREEQRYAKRQMVWFKKNKKINWFDIKIGDYQEKVEKLTEKWYKMNH